MVVITTDALGSFAGLARSLWHAGFAHVVQKM